MNIVQAIAEMQHGLDLNADQQFGYTVARAQATAIARRAQTAEPVAGWRLLPVEPTPEMLGAILEPIKWAGGRDAYNAMLCAAPQPPQVQPLTDERTPMDRFENAIREVGIVAACEWFGHSADSDFTKETMRVLAEREAA